MKLLAWGLVLVSAGIAAAQQPANSVSAPKTSNAKATQESVGASGKDTQSQPAVKTVSATTVTPKTEQPKTDAKKAAAASPAKAAPVPLYQQPTMVTMLQRSNGIRGRVGLRAHRLNPALCQAAQNHAEYMAATGAFSHDVNLGYVGRARRFGFRGNVRENIGWNYATIDSAFAGWQGSGGHYAAIVSPETTEAGFGYAKSRNGQTYWVSVYGSGTAADLADAKAVFAKDKEKAEEAAAAKLAAEEADAEAEGKVVPASAETEVKDTEAKPNKDTAG
ncbi:CAP domain-containing protein [Anatilimnocola floriformis]|uniref:CAP domain-containing protein n=1 Tax=Anatilimnocola floriformis TaxID=2948575 RepID=UPI0020C41693|nr:CAP domain-containing protein [Anatilimnocola floriformis]